MSANQKTNPARRRRKKKRKLRWGRVFLLILPFLLIPMLLWGTWRYFHPLQLKANTYVAQLKEDFDPYGNIKSLFFDSKDNVQFKGDVNTETTGSTSGEYIYKGKSYPFAIEVKDTKGPDLTLKDVTIDTTQPVSAESFIESISDASDYSVRMDGDTQTGQAGTYTVTITAKDQYANTTSKTAKLVRKADKTAPEIEGFEDKVTILQGDAFSPDSYKAKDDLDLEPTVYVETSGLDTSVPGVYHVSYTTSDRSGNQRTYEQEVTVEENPDFGKQVLYMTFDDGPSGVTKEILQMLKENDAKATFFVTGANPEYYSLMKDIVEDGHTIALHTFSHDYDKLYANEDAYFADLQQISDLVEQQTGVKSDIIRFPGGSSNTISSSFNPGLMSRLVKDVQDRGYVYFDWNADSTDASGNGVDPATLVANATSAIGQDEVVLLMHDTDAKATTAQALPGIIQAYRDAGYIFKGLTDKTLPVHHGVNN